MRAKTQIIAVILIVVASVAMLIGLPIFLGEPRATQDVNDAADIILAAGWEDDLVKLADSLLSEFQTIPTNAPEAFMGGFLIPIERLPEQYLQLGRSFASRGEPEFVFRPSDEHNPDQIIIDWAHMRHAVIIYGEPPQYSPTGFYVRKVSDRIYVVANES